MNRWRNRNTLVRSISIVAGAWTLSAATLLPVGQCRAADQTAPASNSTKTESDSQTATVEPPRLKLRTGRQLADVAQQTLRRWADMPEERSELAAAEFLRLYLELNEDEELSRNERERLQTKVRSRLLALAVLIRKQIAIRKRLTRDDGKNVSNNPRRGDSDRASEQSEGPAENRRPAHVAPRRNRQVLPQRFGAGGMQQGGFGAGGAPLGQAGGPEQNDYGEELVELIQTTVAPGSWEIHGGPGTIYYWRPGHALVVSQTQEVHERLADMLDQLQRAGR